MALRHSLSLRGRENFESEVPDMEVWQIVLYGAAALLALKSLAALMMAYHERLLREAAEQELDERKQ